MHMDVLKPTHSETAAKHPAVYTAEFSREVTTKRND